MPSDDLCRRALDGAYVLHFGKLFEALLAQPGDALAYERFKKGLSNTNHFYDQIEQLLEQDEPPWDR